MQRLGFNRLIGAHGQCQFALRSCQTSGTLNELASQGAQLLELPQGCTLFRGMTRFSNTLHLHFPVQIMRHHAVEQEDLIARLISCRYIVHLGLRPQLGKQAFLCSAPAVVVQHFFWSSNWMSGMA